MIEEKLDIKNMIYEIRGKQVRIKEIEYDNLKSKILTSKGGSRKGHAVFTEQGVAMLATNLKSKVAVKVSINIMDAFVEMRKYISINILEDEIVKTSLLNYIGLICKI